MWSIEYVATQACTCSYPATRRPLCVVLVCLLYLCVLVVLCPISLPCSVVRLLCRCLPVCSRWASLSDVLARDSSGPPCPAHGPTLGACRPPSTYLSAVVGGGFSYVLPTTPALSTVIVYVFIFFVFVCLAGENPAVSPSA